MPAAAAAQPNAILYSFESLIQFVAAEDQCGRPTMGTVVRVLAQLAMLQQGRPFLGREPVAGFDRRLAMKSDENDFAKSFAEFIKAITPDMYVK